MSEKTLADIGEFAFIEWLKKRVTYKKNVKLGIGDDAAIIRCKSQLSLSHDLLIEGIDFLRRPPYTDFGIGWRSVAVNVSDIYAMGQKPLGITLALALPATSEVKSVKNFFRGVLQACQDFDLALLGGDLSKNDKWAISVAIYGEGKNNFLRSGALAGDSLWCSGPLGESALGLHAILQNDTSKKLKSYIHKHLYPPVNVDVLNFLAEVNVVSSMIDLSDGLASDLRHLCRASGLATCIDLREIDIDKKFIDAALSLKLEVRDLILYGGEDYHLLWTVKGSKEKKFVECMKKAKFEFLNLGRLEAGQRTNHIDFDGSVKALKTSKHHF